MQISSFIFNNGNFRTAVVFPDEGLGIDVLWWQRLTLQDATLHLCFPFRFGFQSATDDVSSWQRYAVCF